MNPVAWLALEQLLGPLDPADRAVLEPGVDLRTYDPGHAVAWEGHPSRAMYLLMQGCVRFSATRPAGGQEVVGYLRPLTLLGHAAVVAREPYLSTVAAVEPSTCIRISAGLLDSGAPASRRVVLRLRKAAILAMNQQLRAVNARLLTMASPEELVAGMAVDLGAWTLPGPPPEASPGHRTG